MNKSYYKYLLFVFCLLLLGMPESRSQLTEIYGKVTEASSGKPVPFANVYFKGTSIGAMTNEDGQYNIATRTPGDSLTVNYIGFLRMSTKVEKGVKQEINFELEENQVLLREVVVVPEERLVDLMFNWIIHNKEKNNKERIDAYQYEVYNKIQFDINNIPPDFREKKVFKPFEFIFNYMDTMKVNGKGYLPVFISEAVSDYYYRKSPRASKEIIRANKISGVENESITQFLGSIYQSVNIYDNYLVLFDKNFISPIADFGQSYYEYDIVDSVYIGERWCFEVSFEPKRRQEMTFRGSIWINDSTFAVKKVQMDMTGDANLNYITGVTIEQEFRKFDNGYWMPEKDYILVDFNPLENSKNTMGFFGRRTSYFDDFIFDRPKADDFYNIADPVIVESNAGQKNDGFWEEARHEILTEEEAQIYEMIDSIKKVPAYQTYADVVYMIVNGYLKAGKVEFGPYYKLLSFNAIEGARFRLGARTSNSFSTRLQLEGHIALGTKDKEVKYGAGFKYMLFKNPRRVVGGNFAYDLEQLGQSTSAFAEDNFFAAIFRRSPADKLTFVRKFSGFYEHEWFPGFSNTVRFTQREDFPLGNTVFAVNEEDRVRLLKSIVFSEVEVSTRFAFREKFIWGEFNRVSLGTKYPIIELSYSYGIPDFLGSMYEYHRLQFRIKHWFRVYSMGWTKYVVEGGQIWGTLPYPMLKLHEANETIIFYENAYNLMDYYEFISDRYASVYLTHHFDGWILNHIPLMRKLRWRTVVHGRALIGTLSERNASYSVLPNISGTLEKPYYEAGIGVENIFKFFRIDAIWRLSHLERIEADKFRIFVSLEFAF